MNQAPAWFTLRTSRNTTTRTRHVRNYPPPCARCRAPTRPPGQRRLPASVPAIGGATGNLLGRAGQGLPRLEQTLDQRATRRPAKRFGLVVQGWATERQLQLHRPAPGKTQRANCTDLGRRQPQRIGSHHLQEAAPQRQPPGQRAEKPWSEKGRPSVHLHADDPRGHLRHARLHTHRRGAFGGIRRFLPGRIARPHPGLRLPHGDYRR